MNWEQPVSYAVRHKKGDVLKRSRSGGIFTAISDYVLEQGGAVYGCVLTDAFKAVHVRATDKAGRDRMCGSKYIQSSLGMAFRQVREDLLSGQKVLFTGTSCQVDGLKRYLGKDYENLLCVDVVCNGVPSPRIWKEYLEWQGERKNSKVAEVLFRNKKDFGWGDFVETLKLENGKTVNSRVFANLFQGHNIIRPCCYECPYKSVRHPGDITIADYWGIENAAPEFDKAGGVSLVLVNNEKGAEVFEQVRSNVEWLPTQLEKSLQPSMIAPYPKPDEREQFWEDREKNRFLYLAKKYARYSCVSELKLTIRKWKRKLVG